jgi:hypothetical protein
LPIHVPAISSDDPREVVGDPSMHPPVDIDIDASGTITNVNILNWQFYLKCFERVFMDLFYFFKSGLLVEAKISHNLEDKSSCDEIGSERGNADTSSYHGKPQSSKQLFHIKHQGLTDRGVFSPVVGSVKDLTGSLKSVSSSNAAASEMFSQTIIDTVTAPALQSLHLDDATPLKLVLWRVFANPPKMHHEMVYRSFFPDITVRFNCD